MSPRTWLALSSPCFSSPLSWWTLKWKPSMRGCAWRSYDRILEQYEGCRDARSSCSDCTDPMFRWLRKRSTFWVHSWFWSFSTTWAPSTPFRVESGEGSSRWGSSSTISGHSCTPSIIWWPSLKLRPACRVVHCAPRSRSAFIIRF